MNKVICNTNSGQIVHALFKTKRFPVNMVNITLVWKIQGCVVKGETS